LQLCFTGVDSESKTSTITNFDSHPIRAINVAICAYLEDEKKAK